MLVMSANLCSWGEGENSIINRTTRVLSLFSKYLPDFIGVQESTPLWSQFLKDNLKDYGCLGFAREEGGEASHIFYKKSELELLTQETFWLSETPTKMSMGWDGACRRVCTLGIFMYNGKKIALFNTHLDHIGELAQLEGAKMIAAKIKELDLPAILTGDFNVTTDSPAYKVLSAALKDARYTCKNNEIGGTWHNYGMVEDMDNEKAIDHIFTYGSLNATSYKILKDTVAGKHPSDHYFVLAEVQ